MPVKTYLLVTEAVGGCGVTGEHLHAFQQALVEVLEQVSHGKAPVPVLNNVAAIHDLAKHVPQIVPGHLQRRSIAPQTRSLVPLKTSAFRVHAWLQDVTWLSQITCGPVMQVVHGSWEWDKEQKRAVLTSKTPLPHTFTLFSK